MFGRMMIALDIPESSQEFARMIPEVRSNRVYARAGILSSFIGCVMEDPEERYMGRRDGTEIPLAIPHQDPFRPVFFDALK